jgi:MiaB-like tRNA modifying enzyme
MKSFFLEGYGCSLNVSETQQINGFLIEHGFLQVKDFAKADFIIINTCSVKQATEQRMLSRIKLLLREKKSSAKLIVTGCLASAQHEMIAKISPELIVLDTSLSSLCNALGVREKNFSPEVPAVKQKELISIIAVSTGCLGSCTYCSARLARKELHSYSIESVLAGFRSALESGSCEIWITSQDLGCYGFDIGTNLPLLLKEILKIPGKYRIRLGMMNPNHFKKIKKELMLLFKDERLYKFLHLPLQSGSNKILKSMNRKYSIKEFVDCVNYARKIIPNITLSTDIIVGFPNETKKDFAQTLSVLKKTRPDVVNISRFGKRRGTIAEKLPLQVTEEEKKVRSRIAAEFCDEISLAKNKKLVGEKVLCLVSERASDGFNARTNEYRPIFLKEGFGYYYLVEITQAKAHFFTGKVIKIIN